MRIGFFSSKFPYEYDKNDYSIGGSIYTTQKIVFELAKNNDCIVFTTANDSKDTVESIKNTKIFRYGTNFRLLSSNTSLGLFYKPLTKNVDLICISYDIPPSPFAGLIYAKIKKVPMIVFYQGDWDDQYGNLFRRIGVKFSNILTQLLLSTATIIISSSRSYIKYSKNLKHHKEKIVVLANALDKNEFNNQLSKYESRDKLGLPQDKNIILFFSYLYPHKNPDMVLKAFPKILRDMPDSLLLFAGSGVMENKLKALSKKLGLEEKVIFSGFISTKLRSLYYNASDVMVLPSNKESFGNVVIEALYCGLPVILTDTCGCSEIVKEVNCGFIIENNLPYDEKINLISDSIIKILENSQKTEELVNRGKSYIEKNLTIAFRAKRLEKIFDELMNSKKRDKDKNGNK